MHWIKIKWNPDGLPQLLDVMYEKQSRASPGLSSIRYKKPKSYLEISNPALILTAFLRCSTALNKSGLLGETYTYLGDFLTEIKTFLETDWLRKNGALNSHSLHVLNLVEQ